MGQVGTWMVVGWGSGGYCTGDLQNSQDVHDLPGGSWYSLKSYSARILQVDRLGVRL